MNEVLEGNGNDQRSLKFRLRIWSVALMYSMLADI
jgi:hypothetical protein